MERADYPRRASEYKQIVLRELRRQLFDSGGHARHLRTWGETHKGLRIKEVWLNESSGEDEIAVLFRDLGRPECLFGFKASSVESERLGPDGTPRNYYTLEDAAAGHATVVRVNFEEEVYAAGYGLPKVCSPHGISWL